MGAKVYRFEYGSTLVDLVLLLKERYVNCAVVRVDENENCKHYFRFNADEGIVYIRNITIYCFSKMIEVSDSEKKARDILFEVGAKKCGIGKLVEQFANINELYAIISALHELGHADDYLNNRETFIKDAKQRKERRAKVDYRNLPEESRADEFAFENLSDAIDLLIESGYILSV